MARSLNRAQIIGNVVKDGDFRLTPTGTPICVFTVATNRNWKTSSGELKEEANYHRVVAWQKLAEICSQLVKKGTKIYVEGRMADKRLDDGTFAHEIVADDIIVLSARPAVEKVEEKPVDTSKTATEQKTDGKAKTATEAEPVLVTETIEIVTETKEV